MPALLTASIQAQEHARGVERFVGRMPDLRGAHADVGTRFDCSEQRFKPAGMRGGIVVQHGEKRSLGFAEGLIDRCSEPDVAIVRDNTDSFPGLPQMLHRAPSAIVYHDHFKIGERLALQRGEARIESFVRHQSRNNHGHRWVDFAGPRFSYHRRVCAGSQPRAETYGRIVACIDTYYTFSL